MGFKTNPSKGGDEEDDGDGACCLIPHSTSANMFCHLSESHHGKKKTTEVQMVTQFKVNGQEIRRRRKS